MVADILEQQEKWGANRINKDLQNGIMPDLRGLSLNDALYFLESYGFNVQFSGYGSVSKQSIEKGKKVKIGSLIKLELA